MDHGRNRQPVVYLRHMAIGGKRSPLRAPPVRFPGQSVYEEIERVREDAINDSLVLVAMTVAMTMAAGLQWLLRTPPATFFFASLTLFVGSLAYAVPRILRAREKLRQLRQGHEGERAVAEYLDSLVASDGVRVLHDVAAESFNLDHVVIAPQGIYVIETKTISKPVNRDAIVEFDGERVLLGGFEPPESHVGQARSHARWLRRLLREVLGREYPVWPVLFYPGWYVQATPEGKRASIWVLEPKQFGGHLRRVPVTLRGRDVAEVFDFLKRYVRSSLRAR